MATFIVNVQLSLETNQRYTLLRENLKRVGFTKRVISKKGIEYRLPPGNYLIESNNDSLTITDTVLEIAKQMDKNPIIFTVEVAEGRKGMSWVNLQEC